MTTPDPLAALDEIAKRRAQLDAEWLAAIRKATETNVSKAEVARHARISRQWLYRLLDRKEPTP